MSGELKCVCGHTSYAHIYGVGMCRQHAGCLCDSFRPASPPPAVTGEAMRDDGSEDCDCAEIDAKEVLCRVFDDIDEAYAEWDAFDQSGWFSRARALGAFIRTRQDRLRASDTAEQVSPEFVAAMRELPEPLEFITVREREAWERLREAAERVCELWYDGASAEQMTNSVAALSLALSRVPSSVAASGGEP